MKCHMDLIRKIMLAIEADEAGGALDGLAVEGYTEQQIGYHVHMLKEAGLVKAMKTSDLSSPFPQAVATGLPWEGHEFLDAARDEGRWQKAMNFVKEKGGTITVAALTQLLMSYMKSSLGLQ